MTLTTALTSTPRAIFASGLVLTLALTLAVNGAAGPVSAASDYPSWSDVQSAQQSEASKQAQVVELETLIGTLTSQVAAAEETANRRGTEYELAQGKFDEATYRATTLRGKATDATNRADASGAQAGQLGAMLARAGTSDLSMTLLLDPPNADDLLSQLGSMSKLTERTSEIYEQAVTDRNTASSLSDQAELAEGLLGELAQQAEVALAAAIDARTQAQAQLAAQQEQEATMRAQLAVLTENRQATEADYNVGEEARRAAAAAAAAAAGACTTGCPGVAGPAAIRECIASSIQPSRCTSSSRRAPRAPRWRKRRRP